MIVKKADAHPWDYYSQVYKYPLMYYYEMSHWRGQFDSNYTLLASNYMNNVHQINTIKSKLHPTFTTILSAIVKYNNGRVILQWFVCDKHLIIKNVCFNTILGYKIFWRYLVQYSFLSMFIQMKYLYFSNGLRKYINIWIAHIQS